MPLLSPDQEIAGYRIVSYHSRGGMGEVYRAVQTSVGREVALKLLSPDMVRKNPDFARDFIEEARAAGNLSHPNIIAVHDVGRVKITGSDEFLYYFSMEFVDGADLKAMLKRKGRFEVDELARYLPGIIDALAYGEARHMVHRDIKPENIMVTSSGLAKLADFGIALQMTPGMEEREDSTRDEQGRAKVMGTPRYMSPEQARARPLDSRSDQYSLGATLFHLLTGEPPYRRKNSKGLMRAHVFDPIPDPSEIADIPSAWANLCMKMMAKDPRQRYPNMTVLREAVVAVIEGKTRRRHSLVRNQIEPARRRKTWLPLATGAFVLAVILGIGLTLFVVMREDGNQSGSRTNGQGDGDSREGDSIKLRKARAFIDGLPADTQEAIAVINGEQGIDNPYWTGPARELLITHRNDVLLPRAEQEREEHRRGLVKRMERLEELIEREELDEALRIPDEFAPEDRRILGGELMALLKRLRELEEKILGAAKDAIAEAEDEAAVTEIVNRATEHGLGEKSLQELVARAERRKMELHREQEQSAAERLKLDRLYWHNLLEETTSARASASTGVRSSPAITPLRDTIERRLDGIRTPSFRERAEQLLALVRRAERVDRAVTAFLRSPSAKVSTTSGPIRPTAYEPDSGKILYRPRDTRVLSSAYRIYDDKVNWLLLAKDALRHDRLEADRVDLHLAAYFWFWRSETHARCCIRRVPEHPQTAIMEEMDDSEGVNVAAILRNLKRVHVDFADPDSVPDAFASGDELTVGDGALTWETEAVSDLGQQGQEAFFHTGLDWDCGRQGFERGSIRFRLDRGGRLLIGFGRGGRLVRLAIDADDDRLAGIVTDQNGGPSFAPATKDASAYGVDCTSELTLTARIVGGRVDLGLDGTPIVQGATLPGDGDVHLYLQSSHYAEGQRTRIEIYEIDLE